MSAYPESIERLIEELSHLPTIGRKSAQRLAMFLVEKPQEDVHRLADALMAVKSQVHHCSICNNLTDHEICSICEDGNRDHHVLCIVEDVPSLIAIEKTQHYRGLYHVLSGLLNPMQSIGPDDLNLEQLIHRIGTEDVEEVIIAFSPTLEGDVTANFIHDVLKDTSIQISRIASGIPMGGSLEYFDEMTLAKAMDERRNL